MKPQPCFGLAIRVLGLVFAYHGLSNLPGVLPLMIGGFTHMDPPGFVVSLFTLVWPFAVAWWLLGGAPLIMDRAYPNDTDATPR